MRLLLLTSAMLIQLAAIAQGKISKFYPSPESITADDKYWNKNGYNVGAEKCLTGNCEDGTGVFLSVSLVAKDIDRSHRYTTNANYHLYKGKFSKKGYRFEGTYYSWSVPFEFVHDSSSVYRKKFITPQKQVNAKDESWVAQQEIGSGAMTRESSEGGKYDWYAGKMTGKITDKNANTSQGKIKSYEAWFDLSKLTHVDIMYEDGGLYKRMKGSVISNGDFIGGRLEFGDGGVYEGYMANGRFFGPGKYTNKAGEKLEGMWMYDSLASPMTVVLPAKLFEPVAPVGTSTKMKLQGWGNGREFYDAGDNWKYIDFGFTTIKSNGNALTGPGFEIKYRNISTATPEGNSAHTYFAGEFVNGEFVKGMRLINKIEKGSTYETSVVTGTFKDNMLTAYGCARKFYYDGSGKPSKLLEGSFYPSKMFEEEFADGWIYVDDWNGTRDPSKLKYYYSGREFMSDISQRTIMEGYKEAVKNSFCYGTMKEQSLAILPQLKFHYDSLMRIEENKLLAVKEQQEKQRLWKESPAGKAHYAKLAQQQKTCDSLNRVNPYPVGSLFITSGDKYIIIVSNIQCDNRSYRTLERYYVITAKNKGYLQLAYGTVSLDRLDKNQLQPGKHDLCGKCLGKGGSFKKEFVEVGGNSGYTNLGNGWAVKNPETHWVTETFYQCEKCKGHGIIKN